MIAAKPTKYPHIEWLDIQGDGTMFECAIVKRTANETHFINLTHLDGIDRERLRNIVMNRNAHTMPLWDLMMQTTLGNGVNALDYFHQLVRVLGSNGRVMEPMVGRVGVSSGVNTSKRK